MSSTLKSISCVWLSLCVCIALLISEFHCVQGQGGSGYFLSEYPGSTACPTDPNNPLASTFTLAVTGKCLPSRNVPSSVPLIYEGKSRIITCSGSSALIRWFYDENCTQASEAAYDTWTVGGCVPSDYQHDAVWMCDDIRAPALIPNTPQVIYFDFAGGNCQGDATGWAMSGPPGSGGTGRCINNVWYRCQDANTVSLSIYQGQPCGLGTPSSQTTYPASQCIPNANVLVDCGNGPGYPPTAPPVTTTTTATPTSSTSTASTSAASTTVTAAASSGTSTVIVSTQTYTTSIIDSTQSPSISTNTSSSSSGTSRTTGTTSSSSTTTTTAVPMSTVSSTSSSSTTATSSPSSSSSTTATGTAKPTTGRTTITTLRLRTTATDSTTVTTTSRASTTTLSTDCCHTCSCTDCNVCSHCTACGWCVTSLSASCEEGFGYGYTGGCMNGSDGQWYNVYTHTSCPSPAPTSP